MSGVDYTLPASLQRILKKAFDEDVWTEDDVPEDGTSLSPGELKDSLALFNSAIGDGARLLKLVALETHKIRFERWYNASYAQEKDDALDEETLKDLVMTDELKADLEIQKMKGAGGHRSPAASCRSGCRPGWRSECRGGPRSAPPPT